MTAFLVWAGEADVIQITSSNLDEVLGGNELVFVNFYADWCRFSQMLNPIFEEAGRKIKEEYPDAGKVVFGRINCDLESGLASRFHVSKYPTLKLFTYGRLMRREYRGQRSPDSLAEYIRTNLRDPVSKLNSIDDLYSTDMTRRKLIGNYESPDSMEYKLFLKVASVMKDECSFYAMFSGSPAQEGHVVEPNKVLFQSPGDYSETVYPGALGDYNMLHQWCDEKCNPAVRELTFANAEELTEEGLPFFILFHHPDDHSTPERYKSIVAEELTLERKSVNFLVANGLQFTHPLHHLGKSPNDLPVLAIDSFRHMYLWKHDARSDIDKPGMLKQFIEDLHSGKLHREFHQGPDPTPSPVVPQVEQVTERSNEVQPASEESAEVKKGKDGGHVPKEADNDETTEQHTTDSEYARTSPPESIFRKLAPSRNRYTILRDEL